MLTVFFFLALILSILFTIKSTNLKKPYSGINFWKTWSSSINLTIKSSLMWPLRWSSLWQNIGNGWKLLLTVVTKSFILHVTGLLDLTLKSIVNLSQGNKVFHLPFAFSKSAGKTLKQCVKSIQNWKQKKRKKHLNNVWYFSC